MRMIDLILGSYGLTVVINLLFVVLVNRFDILLVTGPLAFIPLLFTLNQRRKE
ncbi:MAG: hypothetical protein ACFFDT_19195 [Candidatus Hodarchaeota archaeon]